ncbi:MAG: prevent-host-death protein [Bacteroidota bacterium]
MSEIFAEFCTFVPHWYTIKFSDMLIISSREFRQNQRKYFEKADQGEQIIVHRGKDKAYALTPVSEDDLYLNAEMVKKIKQSIEQVKQGKVKKITSPREISDLLGL